MPARAAKGVVPRALIIATDLDVLPLDRVLERRDGYLVVRSPSNPTHYWGNLLLFDEPPVAGDAPRWEALFAAEFAGDPLIRHRTFGWDRRDGAIGAAREEFVAHGFDLAESVGLTATPRALRRHARENRDVEVRALNPAAGVEEELWDQVVELQVATREGRHAEDAHRIFSRRRLADLRALFLLGRGAWYVALAPAGGEPQVLGSCGLVVTNGRGRYQSVDTAEAHRRRGICSRLLVEAARRGAQEHCARRLVIGADPGYHALAIYESLGFQPTERVSGVWRPPP